MRFKGGNGMKCILSLRVARQLLSRGFRLVDVEPSRKFDGHLVFIFDDTEELRTEILKLKRH